MRGPIKTFALFALCSVLAEVVILPLMGARLSSFRGDHGRVLLANMTVLALLGGSWGAALAIVRPDMLQEDKSNGE